MTKTDRHHAACAYCGISVQADEVTPDTRDNAAWRMIATYHRPDCEWVMTRAHRIDADNPGRRADRDDV